MRNEDCFSVTSSILSVLDHTGRLSAHFNLEIQSDYFEDGRLLSIEGFNIEFVNEDHNA